LVINWIMIYSLSEKEHKRMNSFNLLRADLWNSLNQNYIPEVSLSYVTCIQNRFEL
jgi:hypothetical protein